MIEVLVSIVFEVAIQLVFEVILEGLFQWLGEPFRDRRRRRPFVVALALVSMGALAGGLSVLLLPERVFGVTGVPGVSLVIAPLATAAAMEAIGVALQARRGRRPYVATAWAGGVLAFAMALVRFLLLG